MTARQKTIAIHQPNYIPWLGYFYKIYQSDIFVFLDDVQFNNEGMQNYHYIKTPQGSFRLKIPVNSKFGNNIKEVTPRYELSWTSKHLKTLEMNYKKSPHFEEVFTDFKALLQNEYPDIATLDIAVIEFISRKLEIKTVFARSSEMGLHTAKQEKILDICNYLEAGIYYSGKGASAYQKAEDFANRGIELRYSTFTPFEYPQLWGPFQSNVTIIDYLMNCGYDWNRVIENQQKTAG